MTQREVMSRRRALAVLGAAAAAAGSPRAVGAQAAPALGVAEPVADALKRVFGSRPIRDGSGLIKLDVPLIAENGAAVPVSVEVGAGTPGAVKHVYLVADRNPVPIAVRVTPAPGAPVLVGLNVRLAETGDVRAIAELADGALLGVKREVRVTVSGCAA